MLAVRLLQESESDEQTDTRDTHIGALLAQQRR
jgi:hypothetical protein